MVTVDASVWVAADPMAGEAHAEAAAFLESVLRAGLAIHQPAITLVEVAAAIARRTGDPDLARRAAAIVLRTPRLVVHPLDMDAAGDAAELAADTRLRAADAIYASTARRAGTTLVTLDLELLARARDLVPAVTPSTWVAPS